MRHAQEQQPAADPAYAALEPVLHRHASFYHLFRFSPAATHSCLVCTGTACHVLGAARLLAELQQAPLTELGVELGTVRCIGTCSGAPLVEVDGEVWNHQSGASVLQRLRELQR